MFLKFLPKLGLDDLDPVLIFELHISDDALIHGDHFVQGIFDAVSLTLQILNLITNIFIVGLQLPHFARFLLDLFQVACLTEEDVV